MRSAGTSDLALHSRRTGQSGLITITVTAMTMSSVHSTHSFETSGLLSLSRVPVSCYKCSVQILTISHAFIHGSRYITMAPREAERPIAPHPQLRQYYGEGEERQGFLNELFNRTAYQYRNI